MKWYPKFGFRVPMEKWVEGKLNKACSICQLSLISKNWRKLIKNIFFIWRSTQHLEISRTQKPEFESSWVLGFGYPRICHYWQHIRQLTFHEKVFFPFLILKLNIPSYVFQDSNMESWKFEKFSIINRNYTAMFYMCACFIPTQYIFFRKLELLEIILLLLIILKM